MTRYMMLSALLAGSLMLVGCGDDSPSLTKEQFAEQHAREVCAWAFSCCSQSERLILAETQGAATEAECINLNTQRTLNEVGRIPQDLWSPKGAGYCIEVKKGFRPSCPNMTSSRLAIKDGCWLSSGPKQVGDNCTRGYECVLQVCESFICVSLKQQGSICSNDAQCEKGLLCPSVHTCQVPLTSGADCVNSDQCQAGACVSGKCKNDAEYICDGK